MAFPSFKNGLLLMKDGVLCFGCGTCGGCTCATLHPTPGSCTLCATNCTPHDVELVFSGISTFCHVVGATRVDWNGATIAGTVTLAYDPTTACKWQLVETPPTTFVSRQFSGATPTGGTTCTGSPTALTGSLTVNAVVTSSAGVTSVEVTIANSAHGSVAFSGKATITGCSGTVVLNNGTGTTTVNGGSGGTCTVTFCP